MEGSAKLLRGLPTSASNFSAWQQRLDQAPEYRLNDEVQNFLRMLRTVGTPMIDGHAVLFIYYDSREHQVAVTGEYNAGAGPA